MATLTIELPDDLYRKMTAVPEPERNNFAVALLRSGIAFVTGGKEEDDMDAAEIEDAVRGIRIGLAEFDAGQALSLEEARAESLALFDRHFATAGRTPG